MDAAVRITDASVIFKYLHHFLTSHVDIMPPENPFRQQTRSRNANAHPGEILIKASGRRSQEEIQEEKQAKEARRQARETKEANQNAAILRVAKFENRMSIEETMEEETFPRRRATGMLLSAFRLVKM
jgi:hypothetical protein